jgi:hypothetical protein
VNGQQVTVTANARSGYRFLKWAGSGDATYCIVSGLSPTATASLSDITCDTITITMHSDRELTAVFVALDTCSCEDSLGTEASPTLSETEIPVGNLIPNPNHPDWDPACGWTPGPTFDITLGACLDFSSMSWTPCITSFDGVVQIQYCSTCQLGWGWLSDAADDPSYLCTLKFWVDNWPCYSMKYLAKCPATLAHERKHFEQWQNLVASNLLNISELPPIPFTCQVMDPATVGPQFKQSPEFCNLYRIWENNIVDKWNDQRCAFETEAYQAEADEMARQLENKFGKINCDKLGINASLLENIKKMSNCPIGRTCAPKS